VVQNPTTHENTPYVVALTGGIASGKTLVSDEFARLGVPIVDTDVIAHEIVKPGRPALKEIEAAFGPDITNQKGELKRTELRSIIFTQPDARRKLESILHPRIRQAAGEAIAKVESTYCILVIPLLAERGAYPNISRILVVDVDPETQIRRLMTRDGSSKEQAEQALASQAKREQRLKIADDVLDNSKSPELTRLEVARLNQKYLQITKGG
jgi:dephospho-CoA kinase